MATKISGRKFAANLIISLAAQAVSIITSFVLGFIVPKFIDEYQYSYWQRYVLYVGYTGVFQFGLLDGLVLRYSQYNYDEIDKPRVRSQFNILLAFNAVCTIAGVWRRVKKRRSPGTADCIPMDIRLTPATAMVSKNVAVAVEGLHSTVISAPSQICMFFSNSASRVPPNTDGVPPPM